MYRKLSFSLIMSGLCYFTTAYGLVHQADSELPLTIEADTAEFNHQQGTSSYIHHVMINQGNTHVEGDKVTIRQNKNTHALEEIIIYGTPEKHAYYEMLTEIDKPKLIARAVTIKYYPQKRYVILLNQAKITQGEHSISGEHIEYDLIHQKMRTLAVTNPKGEKARTTIVINLDKKNSL